MKIVFDWTLLAISLLFCLAGMTCMWFGWGIILNERGWATFIAGAVLLSGGFVATAVIWGLMRLREFMKSASQNALLLTRTGNQQVSPMSPEQASAAERPDMHNSGNPRHHEPHRARDEDKSHNRSRAAIAVAAGAVTGATVAQTWSGSAGEPAERGNYGEDYHPDRLAELAEQTGPSRTPLQEVTEPPALHETDYGSDHFHDFTDSTPSSDYPRSLPEHPAAASLQNESEKSSAAIPPGMAGASAPKKARRPLIASLLRGKRSRAETAAPGHAREQTPAPVDNTDAAFRSDMPATSAEEDGTDNAHKPAGRIFAARPPAPGPLGMDTGSDPAFSRPAAPDYLPPEHDPLMADPAFADYVRQTTRPVLQNNAPYQPVSESVLNETFMTETYLPNPATTEPVMSVSGDQPLYSHATDTEPHAEPPLAPVTDDWMMHEESGLDQELGRTGFTLPHAATGPDSHDKPAGTRNEAAIVGRYVSGDTTYVMFADGSIEAETPDGLLRFATIGDLRHFIEARA